MLAKLLTLIGELKAAGVTVVLIAGAATVTVAGTSPEVQDTLQQLTNNVTRTADRECGDKGQPVVVAQRNAADKLLRAAAQEDRKALEALRGGKDVNGAKVDSQAVGAIVKKYDDMLSKRLDKALDDVAVLTLGREGQNKSSASPKPSESPDGSPSPKPSCSPAPSASPTGSPASASPKPSASDKVEGRVTVAERTTLDAAIQKIVDDAIADMDGYVTSAKTEAASVPAPEHGKPSDNPGNKPADNPGNKPDGAGKPSTSPAH